MHQMISDSWCSIIKSNHFKTADLSSFPNKCTQSKLIEINLRQHTFYFQWSNSLQYRAYTHQGLLFHLQLFSSNILVSNNTVCYVNPVLAVRAAFMRRGNSRVIILLHLGTRSACSGSYHGTEKPVCNAKKLQVLSAPRNTNHLARWAKEREGNKRIKERLLSSRKFQISVLQLATTRLIRLIKNPCCDRI